MFKTDPLWRFVIVVALSASAAGCGPGKESGRRGGNVEPSKPDAQQAARQGETNNARPESSPEPVAAHTPPTSATPEPQPSPLIPVTHEGESISELPAPVKAKKYLEMNEAERREFIERRARSVSRLISRGTYQFNEDAITYIKQYVDAYARRVGNRSKATWGEDLNYVFQRAQGYAPVIIRAFNRKRVPPAVGLYLVAIETEYINFPGENSAGAAGLFQFIGPTADEYKVPRSERTNVNKMADAAASYMANRVAEFGNDPMSVALAIAGYNRGPDSVRNDLHSVMNSANRERSFWTLVANSEKLDRYFRNENVKYVPKFFAAAIIGETPWAFGLKMEQPLSTCSGREAG